MTWTSEIMTGPEYYEEGYGDWVERVMEEPWAQALEDLVKWGGVWCGSEEQLLDELKMRAGKEVAASPDFPRSLDQLEWYFAIALDGFNSKGLGLLDYRKQTQEELDDFDVPGWGFEASALVHRDGAAHRPDFKMAQFELLKYWHPVPVAILHLTASRHFAKSRIRTYTTKDLSKALWGLYPSHRNVRRAALDAARPNGVDDLTPRFASSEEFDGVFEPHGLQGYLIFHKQIKKWAPILKEKARIKVTWEKRTTLPGTSIKIDGPPKTYWTIEAPHWRDPDRYRGTRAIFS